MLFGVIYKSTILIPESSFYGKFVIGKRCCDSIENFYKSKYVGSSKYIKRIKKKYGINEIKREIIYFMFDNNVMTKKEKHQNLGNLERHFIKLYDSQNLKIGMNLSPGGDGDGHIQQGIKNSNVKLLKEQVIEIRNSNLALTPLSKIFGVSRNQIYCIKTFRRWKHI